jgi:hypothetical protein
MIKKWNQYIKESSGTQSTSQGGVAYATKSIGGMGAIRSAIVETNESNLILEEGEGGGISGSAASDSAGSGDVSGGGVAYANQGNISGMGDVQNATVSPIPGDPDGSNPGSGDISIPSGYYTKSAGGKNVGGITGNKFPKMGKIKMGKKFLQTAKKVKDKLGIGKTLSFQEFSNS